MGRYLFGLGNKLEQRVREREGDEAADAWAKGRDEYGLYKAGQRTPQGLGDLPGFDSRAGATQWYGDTATTRRAPKMGKSAFRADQRGYINDLRAQARGEGPSLARQQAQESLQRGVSAQQAQAASARPGQQAGAARLAAQQGSMLAGSVAGASAMGRANEQLGAMAQLGGAISSARGYDLQRMGANQQAQLQQTGLNDSMAQGMYGLNLQNAVAQQGGQMSEQGMRDAWIRQEMMRQANEKSRWDRLVDAGKYGGQMYFASQTGQPPPGLARQAPQQQIGPGQDPYGPMGAYANLGNS